MNRRQAKKKLYKEYGIITPRQAAPRLTKRFALSLIDYEAIKSLAEDIAEYFRKLGEIISEVAEKLGEIIGEVAEKLGEIIGEVAEKLGEVNKSLDKSKKPKYKPVKSLIKPYKQPLIKVRYRARANL